MGKGAADPAATEEPVVTLSTPELTRAELYLVFSVKQKWSYRKLQYYMLRFTHTLGCIATRQLTANALYELDYLWSKMQCNQVSRALRQS